MIAMPDVWPNDLVPMQIDSSNPIVVLRTQAAILGKKTQGIVTAVVESSQGKSQQGDLTFDHRLSLVAPLLGYRTQLLQVTHGMSPYPAEIRDMSNPQQWTRTPVSNQQGLLDELSRVFASEFCRQVISNYLEQSTASDSDVGTA